MKNNRFKSISIGTISVWLSILVVIPFTMMLGMSFLSSSDEQFFQFKITLSQYINLMSPLFLKVLGRSLLTALITTFCCLLIAYPFAYILARSPKSLRMLGVFLLMVPFWTSSLIRTYAIITIIKAQGLLNHLLMNIGFIHQPLQILYTQSAAQIGLIYCLLPFMILPIFANLEKFDWRLLEAARDLGASRWRIFWRVVVPNSFPGILAGVLLVFLPAMTLFYVPDILGGAKSMLLGNAIYNEFLQLRDWPLGAAMSVALTVMMVVLMLIYLKLTSKRQRGDWL